MVTTTNTHIITQLEPLIKNMIPRIKNIQPPDDYILLVEFDDGKKVKYDVKDDIRTLADFKVHESEYGLFQNVQLD